MVTEKFLNNFMKVGVVEITGLTLVVTLVVNGGFSMALYTDGGLGAI